MTRVPLGWGIELIQFEVSRILHRARSRICVQHILSLTQGEEMAGLPGEMITLPSRNLPSQLALSFCSFPLGTSLSFYYRERESWGQIYFSAIFLLDPYMTFKRIWINFHYLKTRIYQRKIHILAPLDKQNWLATWGPHSSIAIATAPFGRGSPVKPIIPRDLLAHSPWLLKEFCHLSVL